jgi:NitT/TauT family transport system substrate-binding protein
VNSVTAPKLSRRGFVASTLQGIAGVTVASAGLVAISPPARASATVEVTVQFDWLLSNGQIGDVVASKLGYYEEEGLNVSFSPGGPNAQTVPPVLSRRADVGQLSGSGQCIGAHGNGLPVRMFACGFQHAPFAFFSLPRAPLRSAEDFVGKRIGIQPTARFVLDAILAKHNIKPSQLEIVSMGFDMGPLVSGQLDVVTGWRTNTKALSIIGPERIDFLPQNAGIDSYANVYFASMRGFEKKRELYSRYLRAVARGWRWSYHNREQSVDILADLVPNLDREIEKATVDMIMELSFDEQTATGGWGTFERQKIQAQIDLYSEHKLFAKAAPKFDEMTTYDILDATRKARSVT